VVVAKRWLSLLVLVACSSKKATPEDAPRGDAAVISDAAVAAKPPAKPPRVEHAVFSLVDNRHAAHRYVDDDFVIDASGVSLARYTRFGVPAPRWHLGKTVDGVRAATLDKQAMLELPLDHKLAQKITRLVARVHGHAGDRLTLRVNGSKPNKAKDGDRVTLADGWQTITIPIEPGKLGIGENQIGFATRRKADDDPIAVEWLRFGAKEGTDDLRTAAAFDGKAGAVTLAKNATLLWYVTIPEGAHFVATIGGTGCKVEVGARAGDDTFVSALLAADSPRLDLTKLAGRVAGLTLTTRECAKATIETPQITIHGPAPVALPKSAPPKYIILWVMDALRADKVPVFTPGARAQTPNIDELAKTSAVFRQFYVGGNESQTSHSTVWTGVYPAVHNVRMAGKNGRYKIDNELPVIAMKLGEAGFYTAAVTGNGFVNDSGGYARGFKEFRNMMREKNQINGIIYGKEIVDAALGRLDAHREQPTYLFFGTIDTHGPWIARKPWIDIYSPGPYRGPFQDFGTAKELGIVRGEMGCNLIPPKEDVERLRAIYDSAISYHDQQVGRLVAQLKSWGIWDQTMLVITADHGEELFEDRRCGHGGSLRDSLVRVPFLVHDPARFPGGTIVEEGTEGVDVMPTLLDAVGAPAVDSVSGESVVPLAQGFGRGWARPSYASQYEYAHAMRIGRWKIRVPKTGVPIVGDLVADPGETTDVSRSRLVERRMLTDNIGLFLALRAQWKKHAWGVTTNVTPAGAAALDVISTP
jgi:arylsulfatase A-like enzyme